MKKILYYNWIQFDEKEKRGGGVTVYQKNIIEELIKNTECEIYFLSSGVEYNFFRNKTYIIESKNIYKGRCKTYKIINSSVASPGVTTLNFFENIKENKDLKYIFETFIKEKGPFDIIHFNNLEGLSVDILDLKEKYPKTKFIFSLHNYYFCCPKVNLWKNDEKNCFMLENSERQCENCMHSISKTKVKILGNIFYFMNRYGISLKFTIKLINFFKKIDKKISKQQLGKNKKFDYLAFKKIMNEKINKNIDQILAVSNRVKEIAVIEGLQEEKIKVLYIGTKFAETQKKNNIIPISNKGFKIAYLGYMKKEKGFYFFIDALEKLDSEIAKSIDILLATKISDKNILGKIEKLRKKFNNIEVKDGYTHSDIKNLLKNVNLGIVPVLWEDNLPQIAIEFVANGVPILTSDLGGAKELVKLEEFIFENNNHNDFENKLIKIIKNRSLLNKFFSQKIQLTTLKDHINKLLEIYFKEKL